MKTRAISLTFLLLCLAIFLFGQKRIVLENPSFDLDSPRMSYTPTGWIDLGIMKDSPTDIQPGSWECDQGSEDGCCFVSMVVRDNNTWERIGQLLESELMRDSSYRFSIWLSVARRYISKSPKTMSTNSLVNFIAPTVLKIWGINSESKEEELLAESKPVTNHNWQHYFFEFKPKNGNYDELDLMVYYAPGHENENGHLLLDECSNIVKISK